MPKIANSFKSFNHYCRWYRIVTLVILITFSSSVISPAFASYDNDDDILEKNQCHADTYFWQVFFQTLPNQQDDLGQKNFMASAPNQSFLTTLKENCDYLLRRYSIDDAVFCSDYLSHILSFLLLDEFLRKAGEKVMRHRAFSDETLQSSENLAMSGIALIDNIVDPVGNIRPAIKRAKANEDYQKSGEIIRNSIVLQIALIPIQEIIGSRTAPVFINHFDQPANTYEPINTYLKTKDSFSISNRFCSKTAGALLNMELPEYEHFPPMIKIALIFVLYYVPDKSYELLGINRRAIDGLKRFADIENIAGALTTLSVIIVVLLNNDKYDKYQIMNVNGFDFLELEWEEIKERFSFGIPVFIRHLCKTIENSARTLTIGLMGADHLKLANTYNFLFLVSEPLIAAASRASGHLIIDSISTNETLKEINHKMQLGIMIGVGMILPYAVISSIACCLPKNEGKRLLATALILTKIIAAIERIAQNELFAFKLEEQNWYDFTGDVSKAAIHVGGFVLFRYVVPERTVGFYTIIQAITIVPSLITIASAWIYGS